MYKNVTAQEMLSAIDNGWHPTWFAVDNGALIVDLCVNYRLTDGKVLFLKHENTNLNELRELAEQVAQRAIKNWNETLLEMQEDLTSQIDEVQQAQDMIKSINWKENQKYRISYDNDEEGHIYQCESVEGNEIYIRKIVDENDIWYRYNRPQAQSVYEVVFGSDSTRIVEID